MYTYVHLSSTVIIWLIPMNSSSQTKEIDHHKEISKLKKDVETITGLTIALTYLLGEHLKNTGMSHQEILNKIDSWDAELACTETFAKSNWREGINVVLNNIARKIDPSSKN